MNASVHSMGAEGAALFAALHADCFDPSWDEVEMSALLASPGVTGLILDQDGAPTGLALVRAAAGEAEILTIGVRPAARHAGLGGKLLDACIARTRDQGCERLFLEVSARNTAAAALYARAGFEEVGRRAGYYRDGADGRVLALRL